MAQPAVTTHVREFLAFLEERYPNISRDWPAILTASSGWVEGNQLETAALGPNAPIPSIDLAAASKRQAVRQEGGSSLVLSTLAKVTAGLTEVEGQRHLISFAESSVLRDYLIWVEQNLGPAYLMGAALTVGVVPISSVQWFEAGYQEGQVKLGPGLPAWAALGFREVVSLPDPVEGPLDPDDALAGQLEKFIKGSEPLRSGPVSDAFPILAALGAEVRKIPANRYYPEALLGPANPKNPPQPSYEIVWNGEVYKVWAARGFRPTAGSLLLLAYGGQEWNRPIKGALEDHQKWLAALDVFEAREKSEVSRRTKAAKALKAKALDLLGYAERALLRKFEKGQDSNLSVKDAVKIVEALGGTVDGVVVSYPDFGTFRIEGYREGPLAAYQILRLNMKLDYYGPGAEANKAERARRAAVVEKLKVKARVLLGMPEDGREEAPRVPRNALRDFSIRTCQACFRDIKTESGRMVLHGYRRPGHGQIEGRCPGVGHPPYERAVDLVQADLRGEEANAPKMLGSLRNLLENRPPLQYEADAVGPDGKVQKITKTAKSGEDEYDAIFEDFAFHGWNAIRWAWDGSFLSIPWYRFTVEDWVRWPDDKPMRGVVASVRERTHPKLFVGDTRPEALRLMQAHGFLRSEGSEGVEEVAVVEQAEQAELLHRVDAGGAGTKIRYGELRKQGLGVRDAAEQTLAEDARPGAGIFQRDDADQQKRIMRDTDPATSIALLIATLDEIMSGPNPLSPADFDRLVARDERYAKLRPQFEHWHRKRGISLAPPFVPPPRSEPARPAPDMPTYLEMAERLAPQIRGLIEDGLLDEAKRDLDYLTGQTVADLFKKASWGRVFNTIPGASSKVATRVWSLVRPEWNEAVAGREEDYPEIPGCPESLEFLEEIGQVPLFGGIAATPAATSLGKGQIVGLIEGVIYDSEHKVGATSLRAQVTAIEKAAEALGISGDGIGQLWADSSPENRGTDEWNIDLLVSVADKEADEKADQGEVVTRSAPEFLWKKIEGLLNIGLGVKFRRTPPQGSLGTVDFGGAPFQFSLIVEEQYDDGDWLPLVTLRPTYFGAKAVTELLRGRTNQFSQQRLVELVQGLVKARPSPTTAVSPPAEAEEAGMPPGFESSGEAPGPVVSDTLRSLQKYLKELVRGRKIEIGNRVIEITDMPTPTPEVVAHPNGKAAYKRLANITPKVRSGGKLHSWVILLFTSLSEYVVRVEAYLPNDAAGSLSATSERVGGGVMHLPKPEAPVAPGELKVPRPPDDGWRYTGDAYPWLAFQGWQSVKRVGPDTEIHYRNRLTGETGILRKVQRRDESAGIAYDKFLFEGPEGWQQTVARKLDELTHISSVGAPTPHTEDLLQGNELVSGDILFGFYVNNEVRVWRLEGAKLKQLLTSESMRRFGRGATATVPQPPGAPRTISAPDMTPAKLEADAPTILGTVFVELQIDVPDGTRILRQAGDAQARDSYRFLGRIGEKGSEGSEGGEEGAPPTRPVLARGEKLSKWTSPRHGPIEVVAGAEGKHSVWHNLVVRGKRDYGYSPSQRRWAKHNIPPRDLLDEVVAHGHGPLFGEAALVEEVEEPNEPEKPTSARPTTLKPVAAEAPPPVEASSVVMRMARDILAGPRPLYSTDPYGLTYKDQSIDDMWTDLAAHYKTDEPGLREALSTVSKGEFPQTTSNFEERAKLTVLKELVGHPTQDNWYRLERAFHSGAYDAFEYELPKPSFAVPQGLMKAVRFFGPLLDNMSHRDVDRPEYTYDLRIALEIIRDEVTKLKATDERDPSRQRYVFTSKDLEEAETFLMSLPTPSEPFPPKAVQAGATTKEQAAVYWVRWFVPRFLVRHTEMGPAHPLYRASISHGGRLEASTTANAGDYLTTHAQLFAPSWAEYPREVRWRILKAAGYKPTGEDRQEYTGTVLSEDRILDWLRHLSGNRYGNNPWRLVFFPKSMVKAEYQPFPNAPIWSHGTSAEGSKRDQMRALVDDPEFWRAWVQRDLKVHEANYAHILTRWAAVRDWRR